MLVDHHHRHSSRRQQEMRSFARSGASAASGNISSESQAAQEAMSLEHAEEEQARAMSRGLAFDPKLALLEEHKKLLDEARAITREVEARRIHGNR